MNIKEVNSAIMFGNLTNDELSSVIDAVKFAIVLLSASILAVSTKMFKWSIAVSAFGALLLSQGVWLWLPLTL